MGCSGPCDMFVVIYLVWFSVNVLWHHTLSVMAGFAVPADGLCVV